MCEPTTILLATTAIAGAVQADRNASKQRKAYRKASRQKEKEINRSQSIKAQNEATRARNARAKIKARAAGSGASGLSISSLLNNADMQIGTDLATIEGNRELQIEGNDQQLQSNLNSVQGADWLGTGLQIAGGLYGDSKIGSKLPGGS
ncbi:virion core protein, T7 gp14 family [Marinicella marina]|uniref:virion core protein, T7 gp14 family n=1 Tax=Marinicella marina TaxID=2996016 RepID=UPI0024BD0605|nr:hypothetical protein [Marinicella marina]MDJ1139630.1 hypothetical protein [Marinicella marina]